MGFDWDSVTPQQWGDLSTALGGMAGGFAQAAMPSRMRIPLGAALGMGAAGLNQGRQQASAMDLQQQQIQAAQLNNQFTKALMPAKIDMLNSIGTSAPMGMPQPGGVGTDPNTTQATAGQPLAPQSSYASNYLVSPNDIAKQARFAMATGQDRAAASLYSLIGSQAGGPGYAFAPNGTAFAVPGGAKDPRTLFTNSQATAAGGVGPALALKRGETDITNMGAYNAPRDLGNGQMGSYAGAGVAPPRSVGDIGGASATPPAAGAGGPLIPAPVYAQRISAAESGGNATATNPSSSATGSGQFLDRTFLPLARSNLPQTQGMSDQQVLALRNDPNVAQQMTVAYARQNAPILQASGIPPTATTLGLAHRFGPSGATTLLQAPPNATVDQVLPANVIAANPDLKGQTVGRLVGNTALRFGTAPVDLGGGQAPGQNQPAPGISQQQLPGGNVQTTNTRPLMDNDYAADQKIASTAADDVNDAHSLLMRVQAMRTASAGLPTGAGGQTRADLANALQTYLPGNLGQRMVHLAGLPDPASAQEFNKLAVQAAGNQERAITPRGGLGMTELMLKANPSLETDPKALPKLLNFQAVSAQAAIDYNNGLQQFIADNGQTYRSGRGGYTPSTEFDKQWTAQNNPHVYSAAIGIMNGDPFQKWATGLSKQDGLRAIQIAGRIDPSTPVPMTSGAPKPAAAFLQAGQ